MVVVGADTRDAFAGLAAGDVEALASAVGLREANMESSGLDGRTFALVKIAALVALGAPASSYTWQVGNALEEGVTPEDILGVMRAVAPHVGGPRVMAAAPVIMQAMGLPVDDASLH